MATEQRDNVKVVEGTDYAVKQRVVETAPTTQRVVLSRVTQLIWLVVAVVLGLLAFRLVLALIGANPSSGFVNFVMGLFVEDLSILSAVPLLTAILYRAFISIGIGYTLQVWGQKHTPPTDAALILGLEAVFAVIAGWIILDQTLLPIQIFGCVVIFVAVLVAQIKSWNSSKMEHDRLVEGR